MNDLFHYDPETGVLRWKERPQSMFKTVHACNVWNAQNANRRIVKPSIRISGKGYRTARIVWYMLNGSYPSAHVDFVNGDTSDYRQANLVLRSHGQIAERRSLACNNSSGTKGVYYCKERGKWRAHIKKHGKKYALGDFTNRPKAKAARADGERAIFGAGGGT